MLLYGTWREDFKWCLIISFHTQVASQVARLQLSRYIKRLLAKLVFILMLSLCLDKLLFNSDIMVTICKKSSAVWSLENMWSTDRIIAAPYHFKPTFWLPGWLAKLRTASSFLQVIKIRSDVLGLLRSGASISRLLYNFQYSYCTIRSFIFCSMVIA